MSIDGYIHHGIQDLIRTWTSELVDSCRIEALIMHILMNCSQVFVNYSNMAMRMCFTETRGRIQLNIIRLFWAAFVMWHHKQFSLLTMKLAWTSISKWINIINMILLMSPKCFLRENLIGPMPSSTWPLAKCNCLPLQFMAYCWHYGSSKVLQVKLFRQVSGVGKYKTSCISECDN